MPAAVPFITQSNASNLAKLSWEKRRAKAAQAQEPAQALPEANQDALRVYARLQELDKMMGEASDAKEWDCLSRAYDRLFKCWQVLSRTPGPGQLRPETTKRQARYWERPAGAVTDAPSNGVPPTKP